MILELADFLHDPQLDFLNLAEAHGFGEFFFHDEVADAVGYMEEEFVPHWRP